MRDREDMSCEHINHSKRRKKYVSNSVEGNDGMGLLTVRGAMEGKKNKDDKAGVS